VEENINVIKPKYKPEIQQRLNLVMECFSDFDLYEELASLSKTTIYTSWLQFLDLHFKKLEDNYRLYFAALNYLMADDYFITKQTQLELDRSLCFMKAVVNTNLQLKTELLTQCIVQIACFYGKHPQRLSVYASLLAKQQTTLNDLSSCCHLHRFLFGGNFSVPGFIDVTKTNLPEFKRRVLAVIFEERSLRTTFPSWRLSKQEAHLLQYTGIRLKHTSYLSRYDTLTHYLIVVRLLKAFPGKLNEIVQLLKWTKSWENRHLERFNTDMAFWEEIIRFYLTHSREKLDFDFYIYLDFIEYKRYLSPKTAGKYSLKGRTIQSLNLAMEKWHRIGYLEADQEGEPITWKSCNLKWIDHEIDGTRYVIEEIKDSKTLFDESKALKHCVYSYLPDCIRSYSSIFGLRIEENGVFKPCCTIELRRNKVVQFLGENNRDPYEEERRILKEWVELNNLTIDIF